MKLKSTSLLLTGLVVAAQMGTICAAAPAAKPASSKNNYGL